MNFKTRLIPALSLGALIRRAISAWFFTAFVMLLIQDQNFTSAAFVKTMDMLIPICIFIGFFSIFTALVILIPTTRADSISLLSGALLSSVTWVWKLDMTEEKEWIFCFTVIAVLAMVLWDFLSQNEDLLARLKIPSSVSLGIAIGCGIISALVIGIVTCLRHINFSTPTYDFGIWCQMFYNMSESFQPLTTCERNELLSHFAVHLSPIYYLLLPFYMLFPSPLTLQIGQAVIVASGLIPLYLLMRHFELSPKARIAFSFIYLFFPIISKGCFFDLHENCFLLPLLLWIFWAYETEKLPLLPIFTILCCMVKEDASVYVAIFALYCVISGTTKKRKLMGGGMLIFSVLYFLFAVWYIETYGLGIMSGRYDNVSSDGTLLGVIVTAFSNPGFLIQQVMNQGWNSVRYILAFLVPLGFLPLASGKNARRILLVPIFLNLLTDYPYQLGLIYQYNFGVSAFFLYLSIMNYHSLQGRLRSYLLSVALVASIVLHAQLIVPEIAYRVRQYKENHEIYESVRETLEQVPDDVSVNTSTFFVSHLAEREVIYEVYYHAEYDTDFLVLDMRPGYTEASRKIMIEWMQIGYMEYKIQGEYVTILVSPEWASAHPDQVGP